MNRKGQTLIIFVILIPIIVTMMAIVVDVGIMRHSSLKTTGIVDDGIKNAFAKNDPEEIKKILSQNNLEVENLSIKKEDHQITVSLEYDIDSLFGKIISLSHYKIIIKRIGIEENGKLKISTKE